MKPGLMGSLGSRIWLKGRWQIMMIKTAMDQRLYLSKNRHIWPGTKSYTKKKCQVRHHQICVKTAWIFALINKLVHSLQVHYKSHCFWIKIKPRERILHNCWLHRLRQISTLGRIVAAPQHCGCPSADVWAQLMSPQRRHLRLFSSI